MTYKLKNVVEETLSDDWVPLKKISYDYQAMDGSWNHMDREAYFRPDAVACLLYNSDKETVILTQQFRMPVWSNNKEDAFILEACAGILEDASAEAGILREIEEETGYRLPHATKVFEVYSSPGAMTEKIHGFIAPYTEHEKVSEGGGLDEENEDIKVVEYTYAEIKHMMKKHLIKDAKTLLLLQHAALTIF
ncbi:MAG: GDP-mannose pyrophosphatase [Cytophagaceae bacterium]|nr:GDP-mannose pyrophosphatase [Cytophagaceae bacterium]|tara:strand:+ start:5917 stop:6492 length:576 start_codon:yes stop_codon:yes gene_type:complete